MSPQTYVGKPATLPQAVAVSLRRTQRKVRSGKAKRRRRRNGGRARECALFSARRWCREVGSAARWQWHLVDGFYTAGRLYRREMIPPSTGRLVFVLFRVVCRGSRPVAAGGSTGGARPCWAGARRRAVPTPPFWARPGRGARETCLVTTPKLRVHRLLHAHGETGCYGTARTRPATTRRL